MFPIVATTVIDPLITPNKETGSIPSKNESDHGEVNDCLRFLFSLSSHSDGMTTTVLRAAPEQFLDTSSLRPHQPSSAHSPEGLLIRRDAGPRTVLENFAAGSPSPEGLKDPLGHIRWLGQLLGQPDWGRPLEPPSPLVSCFPCHYCNNISRISSILWAEIAYQIRSNLDRSCTVLVVVTLVRNLQPFIDYYTRSVTVIHQSTGSLNSGFALRSII